MSADEPDLIGVAEAARITGLSVETIRTYLKRRTIVEPLDVAGGGVIVWERRAVEEWAATRRTRGRAQAS